MSAAGVAVTGPAAAASGDTSGAYAWGDNSVGQLGMGSTDNLSSPAAVHAVSQVTQIAAGGFHSLALRSDGTVWGWGDNTRGELGNGGYAAPTPVPVQVSGLTGIVQVAAGLGYSLALRSDGTVWAWGINTDGQLGDGTTTDRRTPVKVSGLIGVTQIAAGGFHSLALRSNGTVRAWGWNYAGQLGNGTTTRRTTPSAVSGLTKVTRIAVGREHSLARRSDGTVWAWGSNGYGQLGDGTTTQRRTPVKVSGLTGVTQIAAGDSHNLAVRSDGTVRAWGINPSGQLGDGTSTQRNRPVTVSGLTNVVQVSAGGDDSFALRSDGTVRAWGDNRFRQLGDGTTTNRHTPVIVRGLSSVTQVSAGFWHTLAKVGPPVLTAKASISGTRIVGDKLTCKATFIGTTSVRYSWVRDAKVAIPGATAATYTQVAADGGHKLTCNVFGNNGEGTTSTSAITTVKASPLQITKIYYDAPGTDTVANTSLNGEYVQIKNLGTSAKTLTGWTLQDKATPRSTYTFGTFTLGAGKTLTIRTGKGTNTSTTRYWGRTYAVWNNDTDYAYLRNPAKTLIDYCSYSSTKVDYKTC
ncbi:lamin tail domain-containing protein [Planotetraspora silvatica]|uniref:RCC1 domain-containing protein n=1 Tax=Planotetraspora silvatica TaxID=234614 RepID=UPI00194E955C|nr:lamin tail domain-containing protein [Planotetraspora silvatica]